MARLLYNIAEHTNDSDMENYTTAFNLDMPTITLVIGLVIMLLGGLLVAKFVKDDDKFFKWVTIVEVIGGFFTCGSVVMLLI